MLAGKKMFSDGDLIKMGWKKTKEKIGFLIGITLVGGLSVYVPSAILMAIGRGVGASGLFAFLAFLLFIFMSALIGVGMVRIYLGIVDGKEVKFGDLFKGSDLVLPYLGVTILYTLIVVGGFFLLVFPGVIWGIKYLYAPFLVVDKGMSPVEALKASAELTNGAKWDILAFEGALSYVIMIGYAALLVGVVVAIPVTILALFGMYRHHSPAGVAAPKAEAPASA